MSEQNHLIQHRAHRDRRPDGNGLCADAIDSSRDSFEHVFEILRDGFSGISELLHAVGAPPEPG